MTHELQSAHLPRRRPDGALHHFARFHPYLSFFCLLLAAPLLILAALFLAALLVLLPVSWLFGWL